PQAGGRPLGRRAPRRDPGRRLPARGGRRGRRRAPPGRRLGRGGRRRRTRGAGSRGGGSRRRGSGGVSNAGNATEAPGGGAVVVDPRMRSRRIEVQRDLGRRRLRRVLAVLGTVGVLLAAYAVTRSPL